MVQQIKFYQDIMNKITVVGYLAGIPAKNMNKEKPDIIYNFCQGVNQSGDLGIVHTDFDLLDCDLAIIQGFVHDQGKSSPHLKLRQAVIEKQKKDKKHILIADSNLFLYQDTKNNLHYLRYSLNGIFPTTGFYFDKDVDPSRWNSISKQLNLNLKPWRQSGDHILICLQRNGGWSMQGIDTLTWLDLVITNLQKNTSRKIIVRCHPGDKKTKIFKKYKNVEVSQNDNLLDDFIGAWATITYNSSPGVASAIEGIPVFVLDKNYKNSQASDICNKDLSMINNPIMPDRQAWIEKISMCHWNFEELKSGQAWNFIRNYI